MRLGKFWVMLIVVGGGSHYLTYGNQEAALALNGEDEKSDSMEGESITEVLARPAIQWVNNFEEAMKKAQDENKPIFVTFSSRRQELGFEDEY